MQSFVNLNTECPINFDVFSKQFVKEYCIPVNILILVTGLLLTTAGCLHKIGPDESKLLPGMWRCPFQSQRIEIIIHFIKYFFGESFCSDFEVFFFSLTRESSMFQGSVLQIPPMFACSAFLVLSCYECQSNCTRRRYLYFKKKM